MCVTLGWSGRLSLSQLKVNIALLHLEDVCPLPISCQSLRAVMTRNVSRHAQTSPGARIAGYLGNRALSLRTLYLGW